MKLGILIDSGGAIIDDALLDGTNVEVLPLHVVINDTTEFLDTPENIVSNEVFEKVSSRQQVSTSMASPGEVEVKYDEMLKKYDHIIHITITPNLSGMKNTALLVAGDEKFAGKITIIDHWTAANGIKYTALKMSQMINDGVTNIDEFKKIADIASKRIFLGLIPGDIVKLNKGGRTKGMLIGFLKLIKTKFLIQWKEKPKNIGLSRTIRGIILKALKASAEISGPDSKIVFVKTIKTSPAIVDLALKTLTSLNIEFTQELIPSIYGCHAGTDTIGIIAIPKELI